MDNRQNIERQKEILKFICDYRSEIGFSPSVAEITKAVGLQSTSSTQRHLVRMEKVGHITKVNGIPRSLVVTAEGLIFMEVK